MIFAVESAMDELAIKLGIDPYEFRRRNIIAPGEPWSRRIPRAST